MRIMKKYYWLIVRTSYESFCRPYVHVTLEVNWPWGSRARAAKDYRARLEREPG
jgi:hypothetical protein